MNICLVSQHFPPDTAQGGIGTQTWNKARTLAAMGHIVHVLCCAAHKGPDLTTTTDAGMTVHRICPPGEELGKEIPIYNPETYRLGYTWLVLRHLHGLMQTTAFDVIDFAEYGAEGFAHQLDRTPWNWVPVVVQLHAPLAMLAQNIGWPEKGGEFYKVGTFMEGSSIRQADALMACSANIANFIAEFYGIPRDSIDVVYCGVDAEAFRPIADPARIDDRPTVLFVGNVAVSKGVETLLEAVLRLRAKYPEIRLQIVGTGDDGLLESIRERARREGAEKNVEFVGFVHRTNLPEFYRRAWVFCSPAQYEGGVANVFIEAMACGCPVVASTAGGGPEVVIDGRSGLLVPPCDVDATSMALDRILGDARLRTYMGQTARRQAEEYFAMDKYILRVLAVYQKSITRAREKLERLQVGAGR